MDVDARPYESRRFYRWWEREKTRAVYMKTRPTGVKPRLIFSAGSRRHCYRPPTGPRVTLFRFPRPSSCALASFLIYTLHYMLLLLFYHPIFLIALTSHFYSFCWYIFKIEIFIYNNQRKCLLIICKICSYDLCL